MVSGYDEIFSYVALEKVLGFKPKLIRSLLSESEDSALQAIQKLKASAALRSKYEVSAPIITSSLAEAEDKIRYLLTSEVKIISRGHSLYPSQVTLIKNAPRLLYVRGDVTALSLRGVSVVGSRKASNEGQMRAAKAAKLLGEHKFVVVSGLALGIDRAAHVGALQSGAHTTAVIGTPINQYYPKENRQLQDAIAERGTVVSQFSPLTSVQPLNFPLRNELMSGLSLATVIVEAGETSGALTQAKFALSQGRRLYIMKNQIDRVGLEWPRKFLSLGARSLNSIEDLTADLATLELKAEGSVKGKKQLSLL